MIGYLAILREQFIDESGWDKMGRPRPTEEWADEQINAMTNVELLWQLEYIDELRAGKFN